MKIIDVSHWQGNIDFYKVKSSGINGVIIKAGGSDAEFYMDSKFNVNYTNATKAGLNVGAYYFVGAGCLSENDGKADAQRFINIIKGKKFDLPVYMDVEAQASGQQNKVTNAINGFCKEMESKGYYVGVYASDISGFKERINYNAIKDRYTLWVARYGSKPTYAIKYDMWQYSSTGKVNGINGNVDMNECYKDFPSIIKNGGYNGYSKNNIKPSTSQSSFLGKKGYFSLGDTSPNIGKIASFMRKTFPAYTSSKALGDYYGPNLKASIMEFQKRCKAQGLYNDVIDGNCGPLTLKCLQHFGFKV